MQSRQDNKLSNLKDKVLNKRTDIGLDGSIYYIAKELSCIGDILGREYKVIYEGDKITGIIQKPIRMNNLIALLRETKAYAERENAHTKRNMPKRARRR